MLEYNLPSTSPTCADRLLAKLTFEYLVNLLAVHLRNAPDRIVSGMFGKSGLLAVAVVVEVRVVID